MDLLTLELLAAQRPAYPIAYFGTRVQLECARCAATYLRDKEPSVKRFVLDRTCGALDSAGSRCEVCKIRTEV